MFPNITPCLFRHREVSGMCSLGTHCHYLPSISITLETVEKIDLYNFLHFSSSSYFLHFYLFSIGFSLAFKSDIATCLRPLQQFCKLAQLTSCKFSQLMQIRMSEYVTAYLHQYICFFLKHQVPKYFRGDKKWHEKQLQVVLFSLPLHNFYSPRTQCQIL